MNQLTIVKRSASINRFPTHRKSDLSTAKVVKLAGWLLITVAMLLSTKGWAADKIRLQLKWVTQAQFAGYYVALEQGYYAAENLDVTILPGGPDLAATQVLAGGGSDVAVEWMPAALAAREKGLGLINISQTFGHSGMMMTCLKETGIKSPDDLLGKRLGVWFLGNEFPFLNWMNKLGFSTEGGDNGVTVLKQGFNVDPLVSRQADCISTMSYNEYWQLIDAGFKPEDLITFRYDEMDVATLEDGLYVLEERLQDPQFFDSMARFLRATMKGWNWAIENQEDAAFIILDYDETGAQTEEHQLRMMGEIAKLVGDPEGRLDEAAYNTTVESLMTGGSDAVITKIPEGAYTHEVTAAAFGK